MLMTEASIPAIAPCGFACCCYPCYCVDQDCCYHGFSQHHVVYSGYLGDDGTAVGIEHLP